MESLTFRRAKQTDGRVRFVCASEWILYRSICFKIDKSNN